jgi:hypothetical protein
MTKYEAFYLKPTAVIKDRRVEITNGQIPTKIGDKRKGLLTPDFISRSDRY